MPELALQVSAQTSTEVIVVDGASFDGCDEMLAREFPTVNFVQRKENVGFAKANNLGAKSRTAAISSFSIRTLSFADSIDVLIGHLATLPDAGAVGCKLLNSDRSVQTSCIQSLPDVPEPGARLGIPPQASPQVATLGNERSLHGQSTAERSGDYFRACILIKRTVFEDVGASRTFTSCIRRRSRPLLQDRASGLPNLLRACDQHCPSRGRQLARESVNSFSSVMMRESVFRFLKTNRGLTSALLYRAGMMASSCGRMLLIVPLLLISSKRVPRHGAYSVQKWKAILRWSCGMKPPLPQASQ